MGSICLLITLKISGSCGCGKQRGVPPSPQQSGDWWKCSDISTAADIPAALRVPDAQVNIVGSGGIRRTTPTRQFFLLMAFYYLPMMLF